MPAFYINNDSDFENIFNEQLERLEVDYIDILLFHGLRKEHFDEKFEKYKLYEKALNLRTLGKIKHLGFSSHDTPENVIELISTNLFEVILLQYNFCNSSYEKAIAHAAKNGMGVCVMGPLMGGRLAGQVKGNLKKYLSKGRTSFADLGLTFVWANENVHVALSGMCDDYMLLENILLAINNSLSLSEEEFIRIERINSEFTRLAEIKCTGCGYCSP
ncbi:MAG: hypothetical protein EU521_00080 [Promethearchaeota archaeon]|nr:MAG: hypothetical protein EU521_00080 [Candidatus Lokiarchaeota archaeon]